jgi:tRNA dimethylallyltransferase
MNKFIIVVTGATATGKSDLAEKLAQQIGGEIINADIGSWYTPLNIGTAKPDLDRVTVPHHLFNILNQPEQFTIVEFRTRVVTLAQEIWARGKVPVVVGGSAFYIKALWYKAQDSGASSEIEQEIMASTVGTQDLWQQLLKIDPARAAKIDKNDRYRIVRALGIYTSTGQKPSTFEPVYDPVAPIFGIFCSRDRENLYDRVNQRTEIMLHDGWIDEVRNLLGTEWEQFLIEKKIIGYDDIIHYLKSVQTTETYQHLISIIQQKTRNYAKRQVTFLSKLKKDVERDQYKGQHKSLTQEIDLTSGDIHSILNDFKKKIAEIF